MTNTLETLRALAAIGADEIRAALTDYSQVARDYRHHHGLTHLYAAPTRTDETPAFTGKHCDTCALFGGCAARDDGLYCDQWSPVTIEQVNIRAGELEAEAIRRAIREWRS